MNNTPINLELTSEIVPIDAQSIDRAKRFQVLVKYAADIYASSAVAVSAEEAVEASMAQAPRCEEGKIVLLSRDEQRVVASVMEDERNRNQPRRPASPKRLSRLYLALIASKEPNRRSVAVTVELCV